MNLSFAQVGSILVILAFAIAAGARVWWANSATRAEYSRLEQVAEKKRIQSDIRARMVRGSL